VPGSSNGDLTPRLVAEFATLEKSLRRALEEESDVEKLMALANHYFSESTDLATKLLMRVLAVEPANLRALTMLGQSVWLIGDNIEAYACCRRAEAVNENDLHVLSLKASLSSEWEERVAIHERIISLYPSDVYARQNLERMRMITDVEERRRMLAWPPGQHPPD
jgi:hypothetical protein